jgi:exodeoxyribonuclease V alpha subunit
LAGVAETQIICPIKRGRIGVYDINKEIREMINPLLFGKNEVTYGETVFREGDKVMQTQNNYSKEWYLKGTLKIMSKGTGIFNGDIGTLIKIDTKSGVATVDFDGRTAIIPGEYLSELELAYAITVHKSQGSEFKAVILPVVGVVPNLAYRNLLYTAVTRAKDLLVSVGTGETIYRMTQNDKKARRYSALAHFLKDEY